MNPADQTNDHPTNQIPRYVAVALGAIFVFWGVWAMVLPQSFFDSLAVFHPNNQHFVQDVGAFQVGLGAVLPLAPLVSNPDALAVALVGVGIGSAAME